VIAIPTVLGCQEKVQAICRVNIVFVDGQFSLGWLDHDFVV
jgi:hypothetical protein